MLWWLELLGLELELESALLTWVDSEEVAGVLALDLLLLVVGESLPGLEVVGMGGLRPAVAPTQRCLEVLEK